MELMTPKLLAETAGMIGVKELKDAFKEVRVDASPETSLPLFSFFSASHSFSLPLLSSTWMATERSQQRSCGAP